MAILRVDRKKSPKLIPASHPHGNLPVPCRMRGPVCTPSHRGQGRRPGSRAGHAGQEAFDSFARPFERRVRHCEIGRKARHSSQDGRSAPGSGASPDQKSGA